MSILSVDANYVYAEISARYRPFVSLLTYSLQGNAGHIRAVPCGPKVFVRARDNLCLMWTEPLTQGAQR